jgi:hypothetical protein
LNVLVAGAEQQNDNGSELSSYVLYQNYPNPFNPGTLIHYAVPIKSHVRLEIYDVRGHLVKTLINGEHPAGEYTVEWTGSSDQSLPVSSGLYFCRLGGGKQTRVIKLHLVR